MMRSCSTTTSVRDYPTSAHHLILVYSSPDSEQPRALFSPQLTPINSRRHGEWRSKAQLAQPPCSVSRTQDLLADAQSIMEYNGGSVVAMLGKDCVAIACDLRLGAQATGVAMNFEKVFPVNDTLYYGLPGLATDVYTLCVAPSLHLAAFTPLVVALCLPLSSAAPALP